MAVDLDAPARAGLRAFGVLAQTGKKWTYTPAAGTPYDLDGIFDEAWSSITVQAIGRGGIAPVSTTKPAILIRLADCPPASAPLNTDGALKNNVTAQTYSIADTQVDGMGCIRLILNETT